MPVVGMGFYNWTNYRSIDMSAVDGVCLHQIVGELEKIKKSMVMDLVVMRDELEWQILQNHIDEVDELIENINNA
jgi:hypothetical protein